MYPTRASDWARVALAAIRLFNGLAALLMPRRVALRLGMLADEQGAMPYILRMFGIRTVMLGLALLARDEVTRAQAVRKAPLIHATDSIAAVLAGARRQVPGRVGLVIVTISVVNTCLALIARKSITSPRR